MAITLEGTSVKYTISTPSTITINESNIDTYFYNWRPTVTRNKTGSAATRYIVFDLNGDGTNIAAYRAVFTATGKTATVTAYTSAFGMVRYGDIANWNFTKLGVGIASSTALSYFDYGTVTCSKTINLYPTITLTPTYTQNSPNQSVFGRIINICQAAVTATIKNRWTYTGGSVTVALTSSSISGAGKSAAGTTGTTLTLNLGTMTATSITVTASAKNARGLTSTASVTLTCEQYVPPDITSESAVRSASNEKNAVLTVDYALHAINQRGTSGAITVAYTITNGSATVTSGTATICASGTALSSLTGSITINVTGGLLSEDVNYSLSMHITDRVTSGNAKRDIITSTFRLLHFHAGGKGIGIGGAAPQRGLKVYDNIEAESFNGVAPVFGSYVYSGVSTGTITFTDANCEGKTRIICGTQDSGNPPLRASLDDDTGEITVYLSGAVTVARINYICW